MQSKKNPNIILITVDCLRADRIGKDTPFISLFSKECNVYKQAISQGASTPYSFPSLFTSRSYPEFQNENVTFPEILKKEGYQTAAFIASNPQLMYWNKYFDTWYNGDLNEDYSSTITKKLEKLNRLYKYIFFNSLSPNAGDINKCVSRWLKERRDKTNFFLWVHYMDLHTPRMVPKNFACDLGFIEKRLALLHQLRRKHFDKLGISDKICETEVKLYDSVVKYVDWKIGELLNILKSEDVYDNAIIILTSDHGEEFYHNKCNGLPHARMYDEVIRVPLTIRFPREGNKKVISEQVRLMDIAPTILDYLKIEIPESFRGSSLIKDEMDEINDRISYSYCNASPTKWYACIRTPSYKLIRTYTKNKGIKEELYDLKSDQLETKNVKGQSEIKRLLGKKLSLHLNQMSKTQNSFHYMTNHSEKIKDRLKELGYL